MDLVCTTFGTFTNSSFHVFNDKFLWPLNIWILISSIVEINFRNLLMTDKNRKLNEMIVLFFLE